MLGVDGVEFFIMVYIVRTEGLGFKSKLFQNMVGDYEHHIKNLFRSSGNSVRIRSRISFYIMYSHPGLGIPHGLSIPARSHVVITQIPPKPTQARTLT